MIFQSYDSRKKIECETEIKNAEMQTIHVFVSFGQPADAHKPPNQLLVRVDAAIAQFNGSLARGDFGVGSDIDFRR